MSKDKEFTAFILDMNNFTTFLRKQNEELRHITEKIKSFKFEPHKVFHKANLPDEIDLYNFFEKWRGYAKCYNVFGSVKSCHTTKAYFENYRNSNTIEYFINDNHYHAIKFKDRGTFLVSEKRYKELKAKKGE